MAPPRPAVLREGCERPDPVALHDPAALATACSGCTDIGPEDVELNGSVNPGAAEQWHCLRVAGTATLHLEVATRADSEAPWLDLTLFGRLSSRAERTPDACTRSPGEGETMVRFQPVFRTATTDQPVEAGVVLVRVLSCSTRRQTDYVLRARTAPAAGSTAPP